jgi:methionyl-tRNA formyltransferase
MIYLFSNRSYGTPFVAAATRYSSRAGVPITVVMSPKSRHGRQREGPVDAIRTMASRLRKGKPSPVKGALPEILVPDVNDREFIDSIRPGDVGIIAGFDQIFSKAAIDRFAEFVNFHPSLLPYYRGPEPAYWCIAYGETATGFTIHTVTPRIDSGEIQHQVVIPIGAFDEPEALMSKIADAAIPDFEAWLDHVVSGSAWVKKSVDAAGIYRNRVDYRSFPDRRSARG